MRKTCLLLIGAGLCSTLTSCFKDEPLNAECDIEQAYVHKDNPLETFFALTDTLVSVPSDVSDITFKVRYSADLTQMAPRFVTTEGATVQPESGSEHDFSGGKTVAYTVTSQDRQWSRVYNVGFKATGTQPDTTEVSSITYGFEHYRLVKGPNQGQIYQWYDLNADGTEETIWATGNAGFNLCMGGNAPEQYPTSPSDDAVSGKAVKLETMSTGLFGQMVNMRIAAGNLFTGVFDVSNALTDAMKATQFGVTFDRKPLRLTGWYKYKAGDKYQDEKGNTVSGKADRGDIYAVLYRNHDSKGNAVVLHGDDVKTNANIVAIAQVGDITGADGWTEFSADFSYTADIDPALLSEQGYSLTIVCTSSVEGASFRGAVGSTMLVDEIKIIWEE